MNFKFKPEKSNLFLMTSVILFSLVTCAFWLVLREYVYFFIYLVLTLIIAYTYYFTSYFIKENYLIIKLGFIRIKIKYDRILKVENLKNKIKIYLKSFNINLYPSNVDIFVIKLNGKLTNKNS